MDPAPAVTGRIPVSSWRGCSAGTTARRPAAATATTTRYSVSFRALPLFRAAFLLLSFLLSFLLLAAGLLLLLLLLRLLLLLLLAHLCLLLLLPPQATVALARAPPTAAAAAFPRQPMLRVKLRARNQNHAAQ